MQPWTRTDTQDWITQLTNRVEDTKYYLHRTLDWCENHCVYDDRKIFMMSFLTCVWVSNMREESITYRELMEILGVEEFDEVLDKIYDLGPKYVGLDHEQLLHQILADFDRL